jgi:Tfp pilus assembly protein PilZ
MYDRRTFPRVRAPIFFKSARFFGAKRPVLDISLGGMRVYSDESFKIGHMMEVELFLPNDITVRCSAQVVWIAMLAEGAPAKFDLGLQIHEVKADGRKHLAEALEVFVNRQSVAPPQLMI